MKRNYKVDDALDNLTGELLERNPDGSYSAAPGIKAMGDEIILQKKLERLVDSEMIKPYKEGRITEFNTESIFNTLTKEYTPLQIAEVAEKLRKGCDNTKEEEMFRAGLFEAMVTTSLLRNPTIIPDLEAYRYYCSELAKYNARKALKKKEKTENI